MKNIVIKTAQLNKIYKIMIVIRQFNLVINIIDFFEEEIPLVSYRI